MQRLRLERNDVSLSAVDFGGGGPPVVLLHGLAGYAAEWTETASWLCRGHRVLAPDQRGHGFSTRLPESVAPGTFVEDVVAWLDALELERASMVGQSFGGLTAFLTAAEHPTRVYRLVVAEASPDPDPDAESQVRNWLESWPLPFPSRDAAVRFFGGDSLWARAWTDGLEEQEDGLWPRFDVPTVLKAIREVGSGSWEAWSSIRCPTLIVRGERGLPADEAVAMAERLQSAVLETIPGARHDVHLERPDEWRRIVEPFLQED